MLPISVVILTLNESKNLPRCLDSLSLFDDIWIVDSGSTDDTLSIAKARGVGVLENRFEGFGVQRNWAIANVPSKHKWHLHLDADEVVTRELCAEMSKSLGEDPRIAGYFLPSKMMFCGRWLRYAGQYPGYQVRLFHRDRLTFVNSGHGQRENCILPLGYLTEPLIHYSFSAGLDHWFQKHAKYARAEATADSLSVTWCDLLSTDTVKRRRIVKTLVSRLRCRFALRLFYLVVVRGAFLDGWQGMAYAQMLAIYEAMIEVYQRIDSKGENPDSI